MRVAWRGEEGKEQKLGDSVDVVVLKDDCGVQNVFRIIVNTLSKVSRQEAGNLE